MVNSLFLSHLILLATTASQFIEHGMFFGFLLKHERRVSVESLVSDVGPSLG